MSTPAVNTPVEDEKHLNKRGLSTLWELIQAAFRPITNSEIDEITGIDLEDVDNNNY